MKMPMNFRLQAIVLMALGLYLYSRVSTGTVLFYISQRFTLLTLFTAIALMILGVSYYYRPQPASDADGEERPAYRAGWLGLLIVMLPVILGILVPPTPLGASAVSNREINLGGLTFSAAYNPASSLIPSLEKNILDWLNDFQRAADPATFNGQEVQVVGFVYRDERFEKETFMVGRFIVSCCVADAAPVGLIVHWPESAGLPDNQWVEVYGRLDAGSFDGRAMPILNAESVTPTQPPAQPYLYY
jgi:putative membrane protein